MTDMAISPNVQTIKCKTAVKKHWTRNEVRNTAIASTVATAGAGILLHGGVSNAIKVVLGLVSLGAWYNYFNMKKNNVDSIQYTA